MDEQKITCVVTSLFAACGNEQEVDELDCLLKDIIEQEYENRLYELRNRQLH